MEKRVSPTVVSNLSDEVLRSLRRIVRKISEHSRNLGRSDGLTVPQLLCLRAIAESPSGAEVTVASIGRAVQLAPATVSRILDRLEKNQLIIRERRSKDRRKVCLSLSAAGRHKARNLPTALQDQFVTRMQSLPESEQKQILVTLQKIVDMMEAGDLDAAPILDPGIEIKPSSE